MSLLYFSLTLTPLHDPHGPSRLHRALSSSLDILAGLLIVDLIANNVTHTSREQ